LTITFPIEYGRSALGLRRVWLSEKQATFGLCRKAGKSLLSEAAAPVSRRKRRRIMPRMGERIGGLAGHCFSANVLKAFELNA
jgi:hypothetical protein